MKITKIRIEERERLMGGSLPDIDVDFPSMYRDKIKHYMESRYGQDRVCSVGTYTNLKLKSLIKDLGRQKGLAPFDMNYLTKYVLDLDKESYEELIQNASRKEIVRKFVEDNPELINTIPLLIGQPKAASIHASAVMIVPEEKPAYLWFPVRKMSLSDGTEMLVSEWEGAEMDKAGFLKEDILGVAQLDKFHIILDSIKKETGEKIDIYSIPLDDEVVYEYFQNGWNGDVFHFGSPGLTSYCKDLKPETIDDLIAGISLYRPGAMENNFHTEYVLRKDKKKAVNYLWGLEEVTKETYGLIVYQEQTMKACQVVGGLSLREADDVRKSMVKKDRELLGGYKEQFMKGADQKGCEVEVAEDLWNKLEKFAGYSFNKSHASAYSIIGYHCQWLKVHYPIHFWKSAFTMIASNRRDELVPRFMSEINKTKSLKLLPPDINYSSSDIELDSKNNSAFWNLDSVKQVSEKSITQILQDREEKGEYFSFSDFLERHVFKGSKVNKSVVENMIICGVFDTVEGIDQPSQRMELIDFYRKERAVKIDETKDLFFNNRNNLTEDWWWTLKQKELSGFAFFNFKTIAYLYGDEIANYPYIEYDNLITKSAVGEEVSVAGFVRDVSIKDGKNGQWARIILDVNYDFITITIWPNDFYGLEKDLLEAKGTLVVFNGVVGYDSWLKENVIQSDDLSMIKIMR